MSGSESRIVFADEIKRARPIGEWTVSRHIVADNRGVCTNQLHNTTLPEEKKQFEQIHAGLVVENHPLCPNPVVAGASVIAGLNIED